MSNEISPQSSELLSIIIPVYNEESSINKLFIDLNQALECLVGIDYEIIFIDDGSIDGTLAALLSQAKNNYRVRIIELSRNFGKEAALTAGIDQAQGDAVIPFDADLQDPPELILELVTEWRKGYDVVLAKRSNRIYDSAFKRCTAQLFYNTHNSISDIQIPNNVGDFRLMSRNVVEAIKKLPERQRFMKGIFAWVGFKVTTINYQRAPRSTGSTKFSGWRLWNLALEGITSFSTAPLRIWTYMGVACAFITLLYGLFIITQTLIFGANVPGYASILVAILFIGSLQIIGIGILGEYIGRIYMEAKQRPTYIIRKLHGDHNEP